MRPIPQDIVNIIISLLNQGLSTRKIGKICKVSNFTVQKIRNIHFQNVEIKKGGRPKKLTVQDKRFCVRALTSGRAKTAREVTNRLKESMRVFF